MALAAFQKEAFLAATLAGRKADLPAWTRGDHSKRLSHDFPVQVDFQHVAAVRMDLY